MKFKVYIPLFKGVTIRIILGFMLEFLFSFFEDTEDQMFSNIPFFLALIVLIWTTFLTIKSQSNRFH